MKRKTLIFTAVGGIVCLGILLAVSGVANANEKKKLPLEPVDDEPNPNDLADDEIEVIPPGPDGIPVDGLPPIHVRIPEDEPAKNGDLVTEAEKLIESKPEGELPPITDAEVVKEVIKEVAPPENLSPVAVEETSKELDPYGTVTLARIMLTRENMPGWKSDLQNEIKLWQSKVGLTADGLFGVVSAGRMAQEVGIMPLVRYWSKSKHWDKKTALSDYSRTIKAEITKLFTALPDSRAHIMALEESVKRENAQSLQANPPAQKTLEFVELINRKVIDLGANEALEKLKA